MKENKSVNLDCPCLLQSSRITLIVFYVDVCNVDGARMRAYSPPVKPMCVPLLAFYRKRVRGHFCLSPMLLSCPYGCEYDAENGDHGVHECDVI